MSNEDERLSAAPRKEGGDAPWRGVLSAAKVVVACALLCSAGHMVHYSGGSAVMHDSGRRRLSNVIGDTIPSYMTALMDDLKARKKLMEETPPEEVKYWFEYPGPLQKYYYRYSKSRGKADSFDGRDDSGVVSSRFVAEAGGGKEYLDFFSNDKVADAEAGVHSRLIDNCLAMGSPARPNADKDSLWYQWFGKSKSDSTDRCRVLISLNTVGAGRGPTMLWETNPPPIHAAGPQRWISEQETAATHLQRNFKEIDAMCATGQIAARVQVLVCEPIPGKWTDWMDSMLPSCGGLPAPLDRESPAGGDENPYDSGIKVDERPSPVQVVVVASAASADTCHDLKSGFMEKRMQDLILAPPFLAEKPGNKLDFNIQSFDASVKTTHPDLISSEDHDMYIAMKWSSLVSTRAVSAFLQASADLAAAAASPNNNKAPTLEKNADGITVALTNAPSSPFLIPSFVRVSYVSEENNKVAKWRMHGDFFHPAAWEICKNSFDMTWIPDSLSGNGGVNGICYNANGVTSNARKLEDGEECGQWWVYMAEEQMPTSPEVYANEVTPPIVDGGSNFFWMITERQRQEIVKKMVCTHDAKDADSALTKCGAKPQAVIPLGDLESFLINFTPNTALGKRHNTGRNPGYSKQLEREADRELVRERKQLKGQDDIEKALFDYTVYPAALFHKDATIKAARVRDFVLTKEAERKDVVGPRTVKSSYYDVTITKPREATLAWCQSISRKGLCTLYGEYFRESTDKRCREACGMKKNWSKIVST